MIEAKRSSLSLLTFKSATSNRCNQAHKKLSLCAHPSSNKAIKPKEEEASSLILGFLSISNTCNKARRFQGEGGKNFCVEKADGVGGVQRKVGGVDSQRNRSWVKLHSDERG